MKALVFDVDIEEIIHLIQEIQENRENKEAYLGEHSPISMREVPDAAVQFPDWLVIKTRLTGICGSDYKQVFIDFENIDSPMAACATFPQVMGHEVVGTIAAVGPEVRDRRVGQRVVLNPWLSCAPRGITPVCPMCREGQFSLCQNFRHGRLAAGPWHRKHLSERMGLTSRLNWMARGAAVDVSDNRIAAAAVLMIKTPAGIEESSDS